MLPDQNLLILFVVSVKHISRSNPYPPTANGHSEDGSIDQDKELAQRSCLVQLTGVGNPAFCYDGSWMAVENSSSSLVARLARCSFVRSSACFSFLLCERTSFLHLNSTTPVICCSYPTRCSTTQSSYSKCARQLHVRNTAPFCARTPGGTLSQRQRYAYKLVDHISHLSKPNGSSLLCRIAACVHFSKYIIAHRTYSGRPV